MSDSTLQDIGDIVNELILTVIQLAKRFHIHSYFKVYMLIIKYEKNYSINE